jgi:hypothetical protein
MLRQALAIIYLPKDQSAYKQLQIAALKFEI